MGIQGLLPFVRKSCRPANLKDFSGSTVAIDAYSWLHKGAFSCAEKLVKGEPTDGYVYYCMKYLNLIIEAGLTPIMVFDGCNLPSKAGTEKKRRENRERTRQRGKELLCEGKVKEARECFQRCVDVTPEMAREVILACKKKSIDCIVAPYEADAQLAYLAKTGIAQLIITEDSDLILFGCNRILFKMDCNGGGLLFEKENLPKSFGAKSSKFSFEKFLYMCILSGCDYLPSLPGIGLAKAFKFFSLTANTDLTSVLPKLPSYLKMPQLTVPKEYVESFIKAYNTFLYQLVFCPREKKFVPLNPYPEDVNPDEMEYAGQYLPADVACQLAMGNINVKTMEEFDDSQSDTSSVWDDTWGSQSSQKHTKSSQKEVVSAFVFNSQKRKPSTLSNCIKAETADVGNTGGDTCTNEELFAMYRVQTPPEDDLTAKSFEELGMESFEDDLAMGSFEDDSDIINTEDDSDIINTEDETPTSSQSSYHPRELNMPFRKITRSRFFSSEDEQSSKNVKVHKEDECNVSSSIENSSLEENDIKDDCNSSNAPKVRSPVKENKENFRNIFAKRKVVTCVEESPSKKMKSSALIDTIDDESGASTSTVSSSGLASKLLTSTKSEFVTPASPKSFFNSRKKPKRYRTTKLSSFDWKNLSDSKAQLNSSLGSDSNSCDEILEIKRELEEVITGIPPPVRPGDASPFFSTPVSQSVYVETPEELEELFLQAAESSLEHIDSTVKKELIEPEDSLFPTPASSHESVNSPTSVEVKEELVDEDSSDIQVLYSSTEKKSLGSATGSKVLKPIDNKTSSGLKGLSELNIDIKGVARGRCSCGMCDAFLLPNPSDLSRNGWCIYCDHPPVQHEVLKKPDSNSVTIMQEASHHQDGIAILKTVGSSSSQVSKEQEDGAYIRESSVAVASTKPPSKLFPLPEFPSFLTPILNGHSMTPSVQKKLSLGVKDQLIAFLDRENLICTGSTSTRRWEYNLLGKTLAYKYPKMLWDVGKNPQNKRYKKERPNYTVFITRMSHTRKVRRWRLYGKLQKTVSDDHEETTNETSEDEFLELQTVFMKRMSEARKNRQLRMAAKLQKTVSDEQNTNKTSPEDERLELEVLNVEEGSASIKSPVTVTSPVSKSPVTVTSPVSKSPVTVASVSKSPATVASPVSKSPVTVASLVSKSPLTVAPVSKSPLTVAPVSKSPVTVASPVSKSSVTVASPVSKSPVTVASVSKSPVTVASPVSESPVTVASTKPPSKLFPLPEFSSYLTPFLNGDSMAEADRKKLSIALKKELIAFLNRENLICTVGNTSNRRWEYDLLGKTLAYKYPKMLWDVAANSQKRRFKKKRPNYIVFIKRVSQLRKIQRLRAAEKVQKAMSEEDTANETFPEDADVELKRVSSLRKIQRLQAVEKVQKAMSKEATANETSPEDAVVKLKHVSNLHKIQRLRAVEKVQKAMSEEDTANETSPGDAVVELKVEPEDNYCIEESSVTMASTKPPLKLFPLPEFSSVLKPLLNGDSMSPNVRKKLSLGLKNQLIAFLDRESLICTGNTTKRRWEYDLLGKTLAYKYPKMLWDVEENSRKTVSKKKESPNYTLFIKRMSHVRKTRRLRIAGKIQDETCPEDAIEELEFATSDLMDQETYVTRLCSLLKISYELRREEDYSELPIFLLSQTCLETETELRLSLSMVELEERLNKTLKVFSTTYQMEASVWELQKLVQHPAAECSAVTMEMHNPLISCRPGPTLFCGGKKTLVAGSQSISLRDNCTLQRAVILLLGLYFVLNLSFPEAYGKFLKLLQNILYKGGK